MLQSYRYHAEVRLNETGGHRIGPKQEVTMGSKSGVLVQNEKQANKAVAKVMRVMTLILFEKYRLAMAIAYMYKSTT